MHNREVGPRKREANMQLGAHAAWPRAKSEAYRTKRVDAAHLRTARTLSQISAAGDLKKLTKEASKAEE
jgi:hypothetical protein